MRPQASSAFLDLPTTPVTASSQKDLSWQAFTAEESAECEAAWLNLSDEERRLAEEDEGMSTTAGKSEDPDDEDRDTVGVSIAKDKLFEVDVRSMQVSRTSLL